MQRLFLPDCVVLWKSTKSVLIGDSSFANSGGRCEAPPDEESPL